MLKIRHSGIEPEAAAWKAAMLPLHQCRYNKLRNFVLK